MVSFEYSAYLVSHMKTKTEGKIKLIAVTYLPHIALSECRIWTADLKEEKKKKNKLGNPHKTV